MRTQNSLAKQVAAKSNSLQLTAGRFALVGLIFIVICALGWAFGLPSPVNHTAFAISVLGLSVGFACNHASDWLAKLEIPTVRETVHVETVLLHDLETKARTAPLSANGSKQVAA